MIVIPDVEEDPNEMNIKTVSQPPPMVNKIQNLSELHQSDKQYMLPQTVRVISKKNITICQGWRHWFGNFDINFKTNGGCIENDLKLGFKRQILILDSWKGWKLGVPEVEERNLRNGIKTVKSN